MQEALDELGDERDLPVAGTVWSDRSGKDDDKATGDGNGAPRRRSQRAPFPVAEPGDPDVPLSSLEEVAEVRTAPDATGEAQPPVTPEAPYVLDEPIIPQAPVVSEATPAPADIPRASPHLDEEPSTLVAEVADPGAEDGAGAELHVEEPWQGYGRMKVREISDRLGAESNEALLAVRLYEITHKNRRGVLEAVERELKRR
jgi:hypothetical protein